MRCVFCVLCQVLVRKVLLFPTLCGAIDPLSLPIFASDEVILRLHMDRRATRCFAAGLYFVVSDLLVVQRFHLLIRFL